MTVIGPFSNGSIEINNLLSSNKIKYVEAPVMGGPVQAEQGILGAIVGSKKEVNNMVLVKKIMLLKAKY